jgi:hypothetical protein
MELIKIVQCKKTDTTDEYIQAHVQGGQVNVGENAFGGIKSLFIEVREKKLKADDQCINWHRDQHQ